LRPPTPNSPREEPRGRRIVEGGGQTRTPATVVGRSAEQAIPPAIALKRRAASSSTPSSISAGLRRPSAASLNVVLHLVPRRRTRDPDDEPVLASRRSRCGRGSHRARLELVLSITYAHVQAVLTHADVLLESSMRTCSTSRAYAGRPPARRRPLPSRASRRTGCRMPAPLRQPTRYFDQVRRRPHPTARRSSTWPVDRQPVPPGPRAATRPAHTGRRGMGAVRWRKSSSARERDGSQVSSTAVGSKSSFSGPTRQGGGPRRHRCAQPLRLRPYPPDRPQASNPAGPPPPRGASPDHRQDPQRSRSAPPAETARHGGGGVSVRPACEW
jgi:hypothetical protein